MAQPATGPAKRPGPAPPNVATTAVHRVDEKLPTARSVPAVLRYTAVYADTATPPLGTGRTPGPDRAGTARLITATRSSSHNALVAVPPNLFFPHLGTRGATAVALKSS